MVGLSGRDVGAVSRVADREVGLPAATESYLGHHIATGYAGTFDGNGGAGDSRIHRSRRRLRDASAWIQYWRDPLPVLRRSIEEAQQRDKRRMASAPRSGGALAIWHCLPPRQSSFIILTQEISASFAMALLLARRR